MQNSESSEDQSLVTQKPKRRNKRCRAGKDGLTPRERHFVHAYALTLVQTCGKGNARQAAISIGISEVSAASMSTNLMMRPQVRAAIDKLMDERVKKFDITAEKIINEIATLGFSNMGNYLSFGKDGSAVIDWSRMEPHESAAIQEVTIDEYMERGEDGPDGEPTWEKVRKIKFKLHDKKGSLELLARHKRLLTDNVALQNPDGSALSAPAVLVQFVEPTKHPEDE